MIKGNNMQVCIMVLGMHRSGTSALGGILDGLGISMGKKLVAASKNNKKGYFENENIVHFNNDILFPMLGQKADDLELLHKNWENDESIQKLYPLAKEIIKNDYTGQKLFGLKDPRMCILFPFWEKVLSELDIMIKVILPYRDPMEVYRSLQKRDNFSQEKSLLLWVKHVLFAEYYSRKYPRVFTSYDELLHQPKKTLNRIFKELSIDKDKLSKDIDQVLYFLEKDLKHNSENNTDLEDAPKFIVKTKELYLQSVEESNQNFSIFDELREEYITNSNYFLHDNDLYLEKKFKNYLEDKKLSYKILNNLRINYKYIIYKLKKFQ